MDEGVGEPTTECPAGLASKGEGCVVDRDEIQPQAEPQSPAPPEIDGMVYIAGGSSDGHDIMAFYMDRTEVTVAAYRECVEAGKCEKPGRRRPLMVGVSESDNYWSGRDQHPVNYVSALDAEAYCSWVGRRLPTEREWEWAARGRDEGRTYPWGEAEPSCELAVFHDSSDETCARSWPHGTRSVGSKPSGASRDGLLDMAGNVWEWTAWTASTAASARVVRGFDWTTYPRRFHGRLWSVPSHQGHLIGFRCVETASRQLHSMASVDVCAQEVTPGQPLRVRLSKARRNLDLGPLPGDRRTGSRQPV